MEVHFTPDQEAQLAQIASNTEAALRLLAENGGENATLEPTRNLLPVWHLGGAIGPLHRRDINDDVR